MQELVKYLVEQIVANKEEVSLETEEKEDEIVITVFVSSADIGKVIGRNGKTANAIRTIVKTAKSEGDKKVFVKFATKEQ